MINDGEYDHPTMMVYMIITIPSNRVNMIITMPSYDD